MARINRVIELVEAGQPVYYVTATQLSYESGVDNAATWADYININMEHEPFDMTCLDSFMKGLAAGGPARSGHRVPAVVVTLPVIGSTEESVRANSWMVNQALARGVHGLLLCHAETPAAIQAFVESARYPFQKLGRNAGLGIGRRGQGGQSSAAHVWGLPVAEYLRRADVWPLNPEGELILGVKIENPRALANVEDSIAVPGVAFAEWGPGDMAMYFDPYDYTIRHDPPFSRDLQAARDRVFAACRARGVSFLENATTTTVVGKIDEGVKFMQASDGREVARIGREHTRRVMPW